MEHLFKVLLVGDSGVGKTSIIERYVDNIFQDTFHITTIGVDFKFKNVKYEEHSLRLQIWDTAGQERFRTIVNSYYRGSHCVIVVYDITDRDSFLNLMTWIDQTLKYASIDMPIIYIVGSKLDEAEHRVVEESEAIAFIKRLKREIENEGIYYTEVSSKSDTGITELFDHVVSKLVSCKINGLHDTQNHGLSNSVSRSVLLSGTQIQEKEHHCCMK
jgi:Ras-related protein Rab-1A